MRVPDREGSVTRFHPFLEMDIGDTENHNAVMGVIADDHRRHYEPLRVNELRETAPQYRKRHQGTRTSPCDAGRNLMRLPISHYNDGVHISITHP
jgi:hypothetical protein